MNATLNAEQFVNANKTAFADAQSLAATAFGGFERLVDLHMSATLAQSTVPLMFSPQWQVKTPMRAIPPSLIYAWAPTVAGSRNSTGTMCRCRPRAFGSRPMANPMAWVTNITGVR